MFDAVLWALSGRVQRLGEADHALVSKFSDSGHARVAVSLANTGGAPDMLVTRAFDGKQTTVSVDRGEGVLHGPQAEGVLIESIWSDAATAANPAEALASVITRSVYLQQDLVRQFIDSVSVHERFTAVSELIGAGRVTELQGELERQKMAWTRGTNNRLTELQPSRARLSTLESRLGELLGRQKRDDSSALDEARWTEWWNALNSLGLRLTPVPMASREAPAAIDSILGQLDGLRRAADRRLQAIGVLTKDIAAAAATPKPDIETARVRLDSLKTRLEEIRGQVAAEQARTAELRRSQAELQERAEQLRALAALALKLLEERCPVCQQSYDVAETRRRMEALSGGDLLSNPIPSPDELSELLALLASHEKLASGAELELRAARQASADREATEELLAKRLVDLSIPSLENATQSLNTALEETNRQVESLALARATGERFALSLGRASEQAAIQEVQKEIASLRGKLSEDDREVQARTAAGDEAQRVIEALREATSRVVTERVRELDPLLGEFYSRIDVHPAFRGVKLLASVTRGRGQLSTVVSDPLSDVESDAPGIVLSSSQMNALAVCTFLSLNLGIPCPPLNTAILDDPLQSLDDINLLGLIDLLRRTKDLRQLCVSTHDVRFGDLLKRKLRPQTPGQRTQVITLDGWSRRGPVVSTQEVIADPAPSRLSH